jgi:hypothetical protein
MSRLNLRNWVRLSNIRKELSHNHNVSNNILEALALVDSDADYGTLPWYDVGEAFLTLLEDNLVTIKLPILDGKKGGEDSPWDYPQRDWYYWVNIFASTYGWTIDQIAELDIDDAVALLQEIEVESQLEREWEYQISDIDIAYPYNAQSKKHQFRPLNRPEWMKREIKVKMRKIHKKHLPIGYVIKVNEDETIESS